MADFDEYGDSVEPESSGGAAGFFTKKVGPLPMYAWIVLGLIVAYFVWKKGLLSGLSSLGSSSSSTTTSPTGDIIDPGSDSSTPGETTPEDKGEPIQIDDPVPGATTNPSDLAKLRKRIKHLSANDVRLKKALKAAKKEDKRDDRKLAKDEKIIARLKRSTGGIVKRDKTGVSSAKHPANPTPRKSGIGAFEKGQFKPQPNAGKKPQPKGKR
jgi:hypothetical protein